eukprot:scaffold912_cov108-Isochrysis_galbana.AAC.19
MAGLLRPPTRPAAGPRPPPYGAGGKARRRRGSGFRIPGPTPLRSLRPKLGARTTPRSARPPPPIPVCPTPPPDDAPPRAPPRAWAAAMAEAVSPVNPPSPVGIGLLVADRVASSTDPADSLRSDISSCRSDMKSPKPYPVADEAVLDDEMELDASESSSLSERCRGQAGEG